MAIGFPYIVSKPMFAHIVSDPAALGGKPCIHGTRISVEFILELIASGASRDDARRAYPQLTVQDVEEAVRYAARFVRALTAEDECSVRNCYEAVA